MPRYLFDRYIVSTSRRVLLCEGREQPLIPRYFDLLVFLIERRHEAVHRRDIFDGVWRDVVVSDSALSQAIRTIRRTLGDDSREPRFIRTVSRHGYRFVHPDVVEEAEENGRAAPAAEPPAAAPPSRVAPPAEAAAVDSQVDPFDPLLALLTRRPDTSAEEEEQREAAEVLHARGTAEALRRLGTRPGHHLARALLRDTRWEVPGAGYVPLLGEPGALAAGAALARLRLRRAGRLAAERWAAAALAGGLAGVAAGAIGGTFLAFAPDSARPASLVVVLAAVGAFCGAAGGAGVGAGLAAAETVARSRRSAALVAGAAAGGGVAGTAVQLLGGWTLSALVGLQLPIGGGLEGVIIGAAAGLAYALTTRRSNGGLAAPRGRRRLHVIAAVSLACALAALALVLNGRPLVAATIHRIAQSSDGAHATLTPLGALVGEADFGELSAALIGTGEGALFGLGLAFGVTRRPRRP